VPVFAVPDDEPEVIGVFEPEAIVVLPVSTVVEPLVWLTVATVVLDIEPDVAVVDGRTLLESSTKYGV